jgi:hypothetical protein
VKYKNQHFVTESYIKAWCDPQTPNGAFVWVVSKKHRAVSRKSPRSLFAEEDFYTVYDSKGQRILELEHKLQEIEDKFILLRDQKLQNCCPLTPQDRKTIALFIATIFARTKRQKEEGQQIWKEYLDFIDSLPPDLSVRIKLTEEYKQVQSLHSTQPMPYHLFHFVNMTAPYLFLLNCAIYETQTNPGIITSDNPCFWFDPAVYIPSVPITFFGIESPTLNILLPISPKQYLSLQRNGPDGYFDLHTNPETEMELVDLVNGFTATNCEDFIVVNRKTFKEKWFDESIPTIHL